MIHHSCDRCKRVIEPADDVRYVVRMEVQTVVEPLEGEDDDDRDHLLEVHEILERLDSDDDLIDDTNQRRRYDLCPECYRKFMESPVGREATSSLGFSQN